MKNCYIKNKLSNDKSAKQKKKRKLSYYLVLFSLIFCLIGSMLGTIGFVRTFAAEETKYPVVPNYISTSLVDGSDIGNTWVYFPKYTETIYVDELGEYITLTRYYDINFQVGEFYVNSGVDGLTFDFSAVVFSEPFPSEFVKDTKDYTLVYFDNDYLSNFYVIYEEDVKDTYTSVVSNLFDSVPIVYYVPFDNGAGVVGSVVSILTAGVTSLGSGIGSGLSSLASSIFLNSSGSLSVFGILIIAFAGLSLVISLSRLIVMWLSSLGGRNV